VIVPARNEQAHIGACLDSVLRALAQAGQAEVLVVDGASTDRTGEIARRFAQQHPGVHVLLNPRTTTPTAFNLGIREARGRYIAILSAHSEVELDFFTAALARMSRREADIVGGPITAVPGGPGTLAWLSARIIAHPFGVGNSRFRVSAKAGYVDAVPFAVFRREVFDVVGLFDEGLPRNQDTEFFGRVARAGLRVLLDPAVRSSYRARPTFRGLLVQGWRNAFWNVRVWLQNPRAFQWRHAVPGAFAVTLWTLAALAPFSSAAAAGLLATLLLYGTAAAAASLHIAFRTRRLWALVLPPLFFGYHLTYGTGTLVGLGWLLRPSVRQRQPRASSSP
jgi:glycosyltransferase involved in cell wall biosynthesis